MYTLRGSSRGAGVVLGGAGVLTGGGGVGVLFVDVVVLVVVVGVSPPVVIPALGAVSVRCVGVSPPLVIPVDELVVAAATTATVPGAAASANPVPSAAT